MVFCVCICWCKKLNCDTLHYDSLSDVLLHDSRSDFVCPKKRPGQLTLLVGLETFTYDKTHIQNHGYYYYYYYYYCNWPSGCWFGTLKNQNWIEFNYYYYCYLLIPLSRLYTVLWACLKQTMFLGCVVLQLFCSYNLWYV